MAISKDIFHGILSVIGGILIHFTYGHFYTIGNLAPYMTSYISAKVDPTFNPGSAVWISAIALAIQGFSMPLGGALLPKIGYRAVVIIGSAINSGSVLLTYFTIQKGFIYVVLSYAVMLGFGFGFSYAVIFSVAASWFPARRGLIVGFIVGGFGLGALVFTPIQSAYVNPNNVQVNKTTRQFTDPELIERVPSLFLVLGSALATLQLIGIILLRQKPTISDKKGKSNVENDEEKKEMLPLQKHGDNPNGDTNVHHVNVETQKSGDNIVTDKDHSKLTESMHSLHASHTSICPALDDTEQARRELVSPVVEVNMSPLQILRRHEFYLLWIVMFCNIIPITLITSTFKYVGQQTISNDKYLSAVATASSLFNSGGRIMWGAVCDRFSFKVPLCVMLTLWALLLFSFPYIATVESAVLVLYPIWVCSLFLSLSGVFVLMPAATGRIFGPVYMAVNYGLVFSAFAVGSLICAVISQMLLGAYVALYTICGCTCVVGLLSVLWIHDPFMSPKLKWCGMCSRVCQRLQPRA